LLLLLLCVLQKQHERTETDLSIAERNRSALQEVSYSFLLSLSLCARVSLCVYPLVALSAAVCPLWGFCDIFGVPTGGGF